MTLRGLLQLVKRYWKLCVALPVVCALAFTGYYALRANESPYITSNYIVSGDATQLAVINGVAVSYASKCTAAYPGCVTEVAADATLQTLTITVTGPDRESVRQLADELTDTALEGAQELVVDGQELSANVRTGSVWQRNTWGSFPKGSLIVAFLAGLFVAICIVIGIDAVRCPIKGEDDLLEASGLPVIGALPDDTGESLLANVRFASKRENLQTVLVVPAGKAGSAEFASAVIGQAALEAKASQAGSEALGDDINVTACKPLQLDVGALYKAHDADAVLVTASQWADNEDDVEATVSQLKLADANVVGCALVREKTKKGASRKSQEV